MSYYFSKTLAAPFDQAVARTRAALAGEGFGVITEVDVQATLKNKIDVEFRPYLILGACNPRLAYEALELEPHVGLMLPCNVVVQELGQGVCEIFAIDPPASMMAIDNPDLQGQAAIVGDKLKAALAAI